jgi:hypothetical protein
MKERLLSLMLCLTLTLSVFVGSVPDATAANGNSVVYTFGNPNGPFRDLAKEHEEAMRRREKSRKKEATEEAKREKAAKNQAAKERSRKRTAAKKEVDAP